MLPIESLGLSANQWQFLSDPDRYAEASKRAGRELMIDSTRRQFLTARDILARLNGSNGQVMRRGILLADDVGLGKTTVAALVAWVVASAGERRRVRILAPNDVMMRRWAEELRDHVEPLQECAPALAANIQAKRVKAGRVGSLRPGSIQVVKHSYAVADSRLDCELLIIDEAHRAKGEQSAFSTALKRQRKRARRVLILTATPFSIHLKELERMLALIGGDAARSFVRSFSNELNDLYAGSANRDPDAVARRLAKKAGKAVEALSAIVIRHGIDDLPREHASFGCRADWNIAVPVAKPHEVELILRMDRARRLTSAEGANSSSATNDPRFSVGWRHFDEARAVLADGAFGLREPTRTVVGLHLTSVKQLRRGAEVHSKIAAVAEEVKCIIAQGEKVVLFCHHHATAQELTAHLAAVLPRVSSEGSPGQSRWRNAWRDVIEQEDEGQREAGLRNTFIEWLCTDLIRWQTWGWLDPASVAVTGLAEAIKMASARHPRCKETIATAARRLYAALLRSRSSRAVLKEAEEFPERLPGANRKRTRYDNARVLGVCKPSDNENEAPLFIHNQQPDTVISIFNSPFGPDVLVVTDRLSEGIDLHRYCRHLVHYELDPSPIRTVQRNGRLRRVNSWAATIGANLRYAYPAFRGTRDQRLVEIMRKRISSFSLLLGGVQDFVVEEIVGSEEKWRNKVIANARKQLVSVGGRLCAKDPVEG